MAPRTSSVEFRSTISGVNFADQDTATAVFDLLADMADASRDVLEADASYGTLVRLSGAVDVTATTEVVATTGDATSVLAVRLSGLSNDASSASRPQLVELANALFDAAAAVAEASDLDLDGGVSVVYRSVL